MTIEHARPIQRRKLSHEVRDRLLRHIQDQRLKPGDPLPSERELMKVFAVGRPAVREAMQNLDRMGIIRIAHGERARVAEPSVGHIIDQISETAHHVLINSPASLAHLKEARVMFETQVVRRAAVRRTDADIDRLRRILDVQIDNKGNPPDFLAADGAFHREIAVISGNPIYAAVSEAVFGWLKSFHIDLVRTPGLEDLTIDEHMAILRWIERGLPDEAAEAMEDHLTRINDLYRQVPEPASDPAD